MSMPLRACVVQAVRGCRVAGLSNEGLQPRGQQQQGVLTSAHAVDVTDRGWQSIEIWPSGVRRLEYGSQRWRVRERVDG